MSICGACKHWKSAITGSDSGMCTNPESAWEGALRYAWDACDQCANKVSEPDWRARAEKAEAEVKVLKAMLAAVQDLADAGSELASLRATLSAPRPVPRCPRCGSEAIETRRIESREYYYTKCEGCGGHYLDAWRPRK